MEKVSIIIFALIAVLGGITLAYILLYNKLQKYLIRINEAENEIDETLRKKYDILVNMENEINTNTNLSQENFKDFESDKMSNFEADRKLTKINDIFKKIKEYYYDDLDNETYRNLCTELKIIEEKNDSAKSYYNKYTTDFNILIKSFPSNIISRIHKMEERSYFDNKNLNDSNILDFKL